MSVYVVNDPRLQFDPVAHVYTLDEMRLPSVTQILADQGIADFTAPHFSDDVKARGRAVHSMIALDVEEALDESTVTAEMEPYLVGWRAFLRDSGAEIEFWERSICDPVLRYAGTLDGIVSLPRPGVRRRTVLDVKRALYPSAGPQVAAYARCARALYPGPVLFDRKALVLSGDGAYSLAPLDDQTDELTFLAALRCFHWRRAHLKGRTHDAH